MSAVRTGVIGVGSMGRHHARVYSELLDAELVGVCDADASRASTVADRYDVDAYGREALLDRVDAVTVAVPTPYHVDVAREAIEAGVDLLVEKPFVEDITDGRALRSMAQRNDVALQVGHVERFNPAIRAVQDVVESEEALTVAAERLGPPLDRDVSVPVSKDLMLHDVDVVLSLLDQSVSSVNAVETCDGRFSTATLEFDEGCVGRFTASRVTQEKVRRLHIGTESCRVKVDYIDQTVRICRNSKPEFVESDGSVRYHHEGIVEEVAVDSTEPLKNELESFVEAAASDTRPAVTATDALQVLQVMDRIENAAAESDPRTDEVVQ